MNKIYYYFIGFFFKYNSVNATTSLHTIFKDQIIKKIRHELKYIYLFFGRLKHLF